MGAKFYCKRCGRLAGFPISRKCIVGGRCEWRQMPDKAKRFFCEYCGRPASHPHKRKCIKGGDWCEWYPETL